MEYTTNKSNSLLKNITDYFTIKFTLVKLKGARKIAELLSSFFTNICISIFACIGFIFLHIAALSWLIELVQKPYYAYLLVSCFHFIIAIIFSICKKNVKTSIANRIVKNLLN